MTSEEYPRLLFRCCSNTSSGRLLSGKYWQVNTHDDLSDVDMCDEFDRHRKPWNREATALTSTTTNFLRVVHLAMNKRFEGEEAGQIEIIFIAPRTCPRKRIHSAQSLASAIDLPDTECEKYKYEYLFVWGIPDYCVIHRVTLSTWEHRGLTFGSHLGSSVDSFPSLYDFHCLISECLRKHFSSWEKGYTICQGACCFGLRAPVTELASQMVAWTVMDVISYDPRMEQLGIQDGLEDYVSSVGDNIFEFGADRDDLQRELACLEDGHVGAVGELVHDFSTQPVRLHQLLTEEKERFSRLQGQVAKRLDDVETRIGF